MTKRFIIILLILVAGGIACSLPVSFGASGEATLTLTLLPSQTPTPNFTPTLNPSPTPSFPIVARIKQADWLLFIGDYEAARQEFSSAMTGESSSEIQAAALTGIGRIELLNGNYGAAIDQFNLVIQDYPLSSSLPVTHFFLAQSYVALQQYNLAANAYSSYLKLRPGVLDAFVQEALGDAFLSAGETDNALTAYQKASNYPQIGDQTRLQIQQGKTYLAQKDYQSAIRLFMGIYDTNANDYVKAQMNLFSGQAYLQMGLPEQAYARFQDSVLNYPRAFDTYTGLVILVEAEQPVTDLNRGIVDTYAGKYGLAVDAFNRYLKANPDHDGTVHYYKALALRYLEENDTAIKEWESLIADHPTGPFYAEAWDEISYTQWTALDLYTQAAETLLTFVKQNPADAHAAQFLVDAGRIYERNNSLLEGATTWLRVIDEYPASELGYRALFLGGVTLYRATTFDQALTSFQRLLVLATTPEEQSAAYFWIAKTQQALDKPADAVISFQQAAAVDPTGYYSERATEILRGQKPFNIDQSYNLTYDLTTERPLAEAWMRSNFAIPEDIDLSSPGTLSGDGRVIRGDEFWQLGLYSMAEAEYESLRKEFTADPTNSFRLLDHLLDLGLYRVAVLTSRQILTMANIEDNSTLLAPKYFNHIRFGVYFKDLIIPSALDKNFHPMLIFSLIRQESLFNSFIVSSSGAVGLMQIMPATGQEIVTNMGWPANYSDTDLTRPYVNIRLGTRYLVRQRDYLEGDLYSALAAYNGGPGNSRIWKDLSGDDPDLFVEIIRYDETRNYIMRIYEFMSFYRKLYETLP